MSDSGARGVVLAAGGTAGHVEPALNLAETLTTIDDGLRISVLGGRRGLENLLVPARGLPIQTFYAVPLPRSLSWSDLKRCAQVIRATWQARQLLRRQQPAVVVGFGGYVAAPAYLAAWSLRIPIIVHEANARPGIANRLGARLTRHVVTAAEPNLPHAQALGIPLNPAISGLDRASQRGAARSALGLPNEGTVLLVFGGSQGARRLNEALSGALPDLLASGVTVLHAVGRSNPLPAPRPGYHPVAYLDQMAQAYAAADLAVTRAGALTCAELAAVGMPAIYVPLAIGNGEQRLNALPAVQVGGGVLLDDAQCTADALQSQVLELVQSPGRLELMSRAVRGVGHRNGSQALAELVLKVMKHQQQ
ncbi:MAG: undecaprenyldiphospho-muramoylpentapeptide beta-N-acetylglucosaminyltransferase [Actinomycetales bacterium]